MIHLEAKLFSDSHSRTLSTATVIPQAKKNSHCLPLSMSKHETQHPRKHVLSACTPLLSAWPSCSRSHPTVSVASSTWTPSIHFANYTIQDHPQAENDNELLLTIIFTSVIIQCWHLGHTYPGSKRAQWGLLVLLIKGRTNWFCFICFCWTRISNSFNT